MEKPVDLSADAINRVSTRCFNHGGGDCSDFVALLREVYRLNFSQLLTGTLANDAQLSKSVNLICIDGSKFIDRHNPAAKIYAEMVKAGCPKSEDGTPKTMPALQTYWDLLETDKRIALVFYAKPNAEEPKGFSETFLDALRKFDGAICLVSKQPESRLKSFSPTQPNLLEDIVASGREVILENL